jgi:hypothetical protein
MRQTKGAYLSVFTCKCREPPLGSGDDMRRFSQLVNGLGITIGHLILCELTSRVHHNIGQYFVSTLDGLHDKPAKIEWAPFSGTGTLSYRYERQRTEFNEAAGRWLTKLAKIKASDPTARLPLLRVSLPHFFEEHAG